MAYDQPTEIWTYAKLTSHIQQAAEAEKHSRLSMISKTIMVKILDEDESASEIRKWEHSLLREIRVKSKQEIISRIYKIPLIR